MTTALGRVGFVALLDEEGSCRSIRAIGGPGLDLPAAIDVASDGRIALLMDVEGTRELAGIPIDSPRALVRVVMDRNLEPISARVLSPAPEAGPQWPSIAR